jgi:outer membrane immunogenic protein
MVAAAPSWNGCYVGGHAGWAWSDWRDNSLPGLRAPFDINTSALGGFTLADEGDPIVFGYNGDFNDSGFAGGAQAGCDRQYGNWVVGAVADFSWSSLKADSGPFQIQPEPDPTSSGPETGNMKLKYFGTARARLGFTNGPWLFYGTGGLAWAKNTYTISGNVIGPGGGCCVDFSVSDSAHHLGWSAGAGFEWMFGPNWTFGIEYLHLDFGDANYRFAGSGIPNLTTAVALGQGANVDLKADIVRGTVNFRF